MLILTIVFAFFLFGSSTPTASFFSSAPELAGPEVGFEGPLLPAMDPAVRTIEAFLDRHRVHKSRRARVAQSIVSSARKYGLDAKLLASIMIVESRANPFAISPRDSIGIMQIHLPTWGPTAHQEGLNLFNVEDNVDFGARILKDYIRQFGLWDGVKRYKGWIAADPASERSVEEYLAKVQETYGLPRPVVPEPTPDLLEE